MQILVALIQELIAPVPSYTVTFDPASAAPFIHQFTTLLMALKNHFKSTSGVKIFPQYGVTLMITPFIVII